MENGTMMRAGAIAIAILSMVGCGGSAPAGDAGGGHDDAGADRDDAGSPADGGQSGDDAGSADDGGTTLAPDGSAEQASVHWVTVVEPREIDGDIGLDYAFEYELAISGDPFVYALTLERCAAVAGAPAPTCETQELSNLPGTSYVRTGVDPSQYAVGENHYTFHLVLERLVDGGEPVLVDEDLLDVQLDVVSCEMCIGTDAMPR